MTSYPFPKWRRVPFIAALTIILVLSYAPSITRGTVNIRVYAVMPQGPVSHLYVHTAQIQLHTAGLDPSTGIIFLTPTISRVDLVPPLSKPIPTTVLSQTVTSGRYDSIKIVFSNSTVVLDGQKGTAISSGPTLFANVTIPVPPNGNGDVLVVLSLDYSLLLLTTPALSADILQITAVS